MAVSYPPPAGIDRAQYGNLTYDRRFQAETHNKEHGTTFNEESECPICWKPLEGAAVFYHSGEGAKHPARAECLVEWLNKRPTCPGCVKPIEAEGLREQLPLSEESLRRIKSLFVKSLSALVSQSAVFAISFSMRSPITGFSFLGFLSAIGVFAGSLKTIDQIKKREIAPDDLEATSLESVNRFTLIAAPFIALAIGVDYAVSLPSRILRGIYC